MYSPNAFAVSDLPKLHEFIELHSFAVLASFDGREPVASHMPLLLDRARGQKGTLIGHLAAANPQATSADGQMVLAIFQGPHAYISPTWYEAANVVPTWNYVAVHAGGRFERIADRVRKREIVTRYVDFFEAGQPNPWSLDDADAEFVEKLLQGIEGFEIEIERLEGKWKLNQNHDLARRERVIRALEEAGDEQMAALIAKTLRQP